MRKKIYDTIETIRQIKEKRIIVGKDSPESQPMLSLRNKKPVGTVFAAAGSVLLLLSYILSSVLLTFMGLGLILWAVIMFYAVRQRQIPEEVFVSASLASMNALKSVVTGLGYEGEVIFFHPKSLQGLKRGYIFFAKEHDATIPVEAHQSTDRMFFDNPEGILLGAPGQNLLDLIEEKMGANLATVGLSFVMERLPSVFIEDLGLANSLTFEYANNTIEVSLRGNPAVNICKRVREKAGGAKHFECPICSTLALIFSKTTGNPIAIAKNEGNAGGSKTVLRRLPN